MSSDLPIAVLAVFGASLALAGGAIAAPQSNSGGATAPTGPVTAGAASISAGTRARLERIAACESGGDPTAVSPDGRYRGKYQFSRRTWASLGGHGDPAAASEDEQDRRAARLLARRGTDPWPACG